MSMAAWMCLLPTFAADPSPEAYSRSAVGLSRKQTPIVLHSSPTWHDPRSTTMHVLLVGIDEAEPVLACLKWFRTSAEAKKHRARFSLAGVPRLHVDGPKPAAEHPFKGDYSDKDHPEAAYLWRRLGVLAPDLVVVVRRGKETTWALPATMPVRLAEALRPAPGKAEARGLAAALGRSAPADVGLIPALEVVAPADKPETWLPMLLEALEKARLHDPSPARIEVRKRLDRKPIEVAKQLAEVYGRRLDSVEYIGGMALVGRLRLGERKDVDRILSPWLDGTKPIDDERAGPAQLAGRLVFGEAARVGKDEKAVALMRRAADRCLGAGGVPGHAEMSDSVFMGCPLLALTGSLTGERKYFDGCVKNLELMRKLTARKDGLYRHSPLDETAWGRGNGFPALGLALALTDMPKDHPGRAAMLEAFREHLDALLPHQDADGSWHQVIDVPGSWPELSCTCMIAFAMARGLRLGLLDKERYEAPLRRAWEAILIRTAPDGSLIDVCTGTGKQRSLRDYLDRKAILGRDPRGGAMALTIAVEMAVRDGSLPANR